MQYLCVQYQRNLTCTRKYRSCTNPEFTVTYSRIRLKKSYVRCLYIHTPVRVSDDEIAICRGVYSNVGGELEATLVPTWVLRIEKTLLEAVVWDQLKQFTLYIRIQLIK